VCHNNNDDGNADGDAVGGTCKFYRRIPQYRLASLAASEMHVTGSVLVARVNKHVTHPMLQQNLVNAEEKAVKASSGVDNATSQNSDRCSTSNYPQPTNYSQANTN
jgi:hypothetical protein